MGEVVVALVQVLAVAEACEIQPRTEGVVLIVAPGLPVPVLEQPEQPARPAVQPVQPAHAPAVAHVPAAWLRRLVDSQRRPLIGGAG